MKAILAIDGGGTKTRCSLFSLDGAELAACESGASNHLLVGIETVRNSIEEAVHRVLSDAGIAASDVFVSAGLAGIDYDGRGADVIERIFASFGFEHVLLNGDSVTAHAGALGGGPGVLALAGTGSAVLAVDARGQRTKVGGWGPVFGDEGSSYAVGEHALRAAARSVDGRGAATSLVAKIVDFWGLTDFRDTVERVYVARSQPRDIAALAPLVVAAAHEGDMVAASILGACGADLGEAVLAAIGRMELNRFPVTVSWQGSLLEYCAPIRTALAKMLRSASPPAVLAPPLHPPITGAYLLGVKALSENAQCT
jgi:glucosamine kinase